MAKIASIGRTAGPSSFRRKPPNLTFASLYAKYSLGVNPDANSMPRIGSCLLDGFEGFEAKLIDHLENDHAETHRRLNVDQWRDWLRQNTRVEDRLQPPNATPWIKRQYSVRIETGIGASEPENSD